MFACHNVALIFPNIWRNERSPKLSFSEIPSHDFCRAYLVRQNMILLSVIDIQEMRAIYNVQQKPIRDNYKMIRYKNIGLYGHILECLSIYMQ